MSFIPFPEGRLYWVDERNFKSSDESISRERVVIREISVRFVCRTFSRSVSVKGLPCNLRVIQGFKPGLQHCRQILYQLSHKGRPRKLEWVAYPFSSRSSRPRNLTRSPPPQADSLPAESPGKPTSAGGMGLIPGSGRFPGGGNGNPLQYSFLENPMDTGDVGCGTQSMGMQRVRHD